MFVSSMFQHSTKLRKGNDAAMLRDDNLIFIDSMVEVEEQLSSYVRSFHYIKEKGMEVTILLLVQH